MHEALSQRRTLADHAASSDNTIGKPVLTAEWRAWGDSDR